MNNKKISMVEGSIIFWIPKETIDYKDDKSYILVNKSNQEGAIFILKDNDKKIKFFHVLMGKGRTDVEVDVSDLSDKERHMVGTTWSVKNKKINIYIDGNKKHAKTSIQY